MPAHRQSHPLPSYEGAPRRQAKPQVRFAVPYSLRRVFFAFRSGRQDEPATKTSPRWWTPPVVNFRSEDAAFHAPARDFTTKKCPARNKSTPVGERDNNKFARC